MNLQLYDPRSRTYDPPKLRLRQSPCQEVTTTLFALWLLAELTPNAQNGDGD